MDPFDPGIPHNNSKMMVLKVFSSLPHGGASKGYISRHLEHGFWGSCCLLHSEELAKTKAIVLSSGPVKSSLCFKMKNTDQFSIFMGQSNI